VLFKAEAMGFGDVKFSVFMGLVLGPRPTFSAVVVGFILAGVVAVTLVVLRVRTMRDSIPYGPFLAAGAAAALFTLGTT
jgi:leader peptidase (prepilin peptidase)/N-methyltransferase